MKKLLPILIITSASLYAATETPTASAPKAISIPTQSAQFVIRFADPYKIIQGLEEWKEESARIQQELGSRSNQIQALQQSGQKKAQELQTMAGTAKPSVVEARREELLNMQNQIQIKQQALEEYAQRVSQESQMKILKSIEEATEEISKEKGYDIVLGGGALFVKPTLDIADEVASRMNKKYAEKKKRQTKKALPASKINEIAAK